jgi:hypothetical protein
MFEIRSTTSHTLVHSQSRHWRCATCDETREMEPSDYDDEY